MTMNESTKPKANEKRIVMTIGGKGGIGKSLCAQIARETLTGEDRTKKVIVIDSDVNNSAMSQIYSEVTFVPIRDVTNLEARGALIEAVKSLASGRADAIVWDLGAGTEDIVRERFLTDVSRWAERGGIDLIAIRPITTSAFSQMQAVQFAHWASDHGVATVIVRNLGQGRSRESFDHWRSVAERHQVCPPAVEVDLDDLGAWVSDESTALGLSLADVALARFGHLEDGARAVAEARLTSAVQLAVADYLETHCAAFDAAFARAIENLRLRG